MAGPKAEIVRFDSHVLYQGRLFVPGRHGFSPEEKEKNCDTIAKRIRDINHWSHLLPEFFSFNPPTGAPVEFIASIGKDKGQLAVKSASAPYSPRNLLVVARPEHLETDQDGVVRPYYIWDKAFSPRMQELYLVTAMHLLQQSHTTAIEEGGDQKAFMTENVIKELSTAEKPTSRSVSVPHTHVLLIDRESIVADGSNPTLQHLVDENRLLQNDRFMTPKVQRLYAKMHNYGADGILFKMGIRTKEPYGYGVMLPQINPKNIMDYIPDIHRLLKAHHMAYEDVMAQTIANTRKVVAMKYGKEADANLERSLISQPSYTMVAHFNEWDSLEIDYSPEVKSHAGPLERCGVHLGRAEGENGKLAHHDPRVRSFQTAAALTVGKMLTSMATINFR